MSTPKPHPDAGRPVNRLARESSPYLLQHAHNPVDWWPWCDGAFEEARRRGVPVFLSVGYSTCYWCHVMERESFEDPSTARVMNERYVCIKVDREERPDVDDVYMAAVQMMTGQGGWPMSVFLEPERRRPFWGGTYFPPRPAYGRPSFVQVLERLSEAWKRDREKVVGQSEVVAAAVREHLGAKPGEARRLSASHVESAVRTLLTIHDRAEGGFGRAPKFPQPVYLRLLLECRRAAADPETRGAIDGAVLRTLEAMSLGGMHDHVGGGFHRYSVDATWTVPHFEKMLYDNAQLLEVYAEASAEYQDPWLARTARRTAAYVLKEMRQASGLFSTAQDAEVDGREGLNYLWRPEEIDAVLPPEEARFARRVFGLDRGANFQDPHHPSDPPRNVLRLSAPVRALADEEGVSEEAFIARLDRVCAALYQRRCERKPAALDDKVLLGWNGMMIASLARASTLLGEPEWLSAAQRAADVLLRAMRPEPGAPLHRVLRAPGWDAHAPGPAPKIPAVLEDFAALALGLLAIHRAHAEAGTCPTDGHGERLATDHWLRTALGVIDEALAAFADPKSGELFDTRADAGGLFVRTRSTYDGAVPSGQSMMLDAVITAHRWTGEHRLLERAWSIVAGLSTAIDDSPVSTANSVRGLMRLLAIDEDGLSAYLRQAGAPRGGGDAPAREATGSAGVVRVLAAAEELVVTRDVPGVLPVRLEIEEGFHINDAQAGEASGGALLALRVDVVGATGLNVYADYPAGSVYPGATHGVLTGAVEFSVVAEWDAAAEKVEGEPRLVVTFQACSETACLAPARVELGVPVRVE
jgi:uncharacterized protein YyaL (SSP411 family)